MKSGWRAYCVILFRWLGGVELALSLIAAAAVSVAWGTYLEAKSESHLVAASVVYGHPAFTALLLLFFVNILFSSLRRWPFQKKHLPFLVTHLGLLLVLAGTLSKQQWGLQGVMTLDREESSHQVTLPHQFSLFIRKSGSSTQEWQIPIDLSRHHVPLSLPERSTLAIRQIGTLTHAKARWHSWIHQGWGYLIGFPSLPTHKWEPQKALPLPYRLALQKKQAWQVLFLETEQFAEAKTLFVAKAEKPTLWFLRNKRGETLLLAADKQGQLREKMFSQEIPDQLVAYEGGVLGYGAQVVLDFTPPLVLETPAFPSFHPQLPLAKREEETPALVVEIEEMGRKSRLVLGYDSSLRPLLWPALEGEYLMRLGPRKEEIFYHLRLQEARRILYPDSSDVAAYEADISIEKNGKRQNIGLAMNRVFETDDGYRFYLSGMANDHSSSIQRVVLAVNRDPFKYFLTYPGALLLVLGSGWLFFFSQPAKRPKRIEAL